MEESDPEKCCALESSLWEIQTLQMHVLPSVATAARFINSPLPSMEMDMTKHLDGTLDEVLFNVKFNVVYSYIFLVLYVEHSVYMSGDFC